MKTGLDKRSYLVKEKKTDENIGITEKTKKPKSQGPIKAYPERLSARANLPWLFIFGRTPGLGM
jgi:hypothetical protein